MEIQCSVHISEILKTTGVILKTINLTIVFIGEVKAVKDLWIIGDKFLLDIYSRLSKLKTDAIIEKRAIPYIHDAYKV